MKRKSTQEAKKPSKKLKTINPDSSFSEYESEKEESLSSIEVESDSCIGSDVDQALISEKNQKKSSKAQKNLGKEAKAKISASSYKVFIIYLN